MAEMGEGPVVCSMEYWCGWHDSRHAHAGEYCAANPLLWGPGLILGLVVNRFTLKRIACWVWLAGVVWMVCGILAALFSYHARFAGVCSPLDSLTNGFFFSVPKQPYCGDHGNLMIFTLPMLSAIAYSLGAWIMLVFVRRARLSPHPVKQ